MKPVDVADYQALEVCDRCSIDWHEWGIENAKEAIANSFNVISENLPPTEDPRVLKRAMENCTDEMGWDSTCSQSIIDSWIKEATEKLENEATR